MPASHTIPAGGAGDSHNYDPAAADLRAWQARLGRRVAADHADVAAHERRRGWGLDGQPSGRPRRQPVTLRGLAAYADAVAAEAERTNAEVRRMVLSFPDLVERLCGPPLSYRRPDQWSGHIPPAVWSGALNTSPRRRALIDLVTEAHRRATQTQPATAATGTGGP